MAKINLSRGAVAIIDDEDYERASAHKWSLSGNGYALRGVSGTPKNARKYQTLHRFIMNEPDGSVDHINGNKLDCRKENLRAVSRSLNAYNCSRSAPISGHRGVYWDKSANGFRVLCRVDGRSKYLGFSNNKEKAYKIYQDFVASRPDLFPQVEGANWKRYIGDQS